MIKVYKARNGFTHTDPERVRKEEITECENELGKILDSAVNFGKLTPNVRLAILVELFANGDKVRKILTNHRDTLAYDVDERDY